MVGRSLFFDSAGAALALGLVVHSAGASPVTSVQFTDGNVLDIQSVVGTGSNAAYLAVDFNDGLNEAWQYNFDGSIDGYTLLSSLLSPATTLQADDPYFTEYQEHLVDYLTDGSNTTNKYPALYFSPPSPGDDPSYDGISSQGITFEQAQVGIDDLAITNGEIVGWDNSYTEVPTLPETAAPEPATAGLLGIISTVMLKRRDRAGSVSR